MPSLRVFKNGEHLCTVGSADAWMFSASVWADAFAPEASSLDVTGSTLAADGGHGEFLIWECPHQLAFGDAIDLSFDADDKSNPLGKVFVPDAEEMLEPAFDWSDPPTEAQIRALELRRLRNVNAKWSVVVNQTRRFELQPDPTRQHISLHVLWNNHCPDRLRLSISRSSIREIATRAGGEEVLLEYLSIGSSVSVTVGA
jgi:hypothetical protein